MTPSERRIAAHLGACSFLPASWDKRFARDMAFHANNAPDKPLSAAQSAHLLRLCQKYRRQIPTAVLLECLDEMERQAQRRVEIGVGALPNFSPAKQRRLAEAVKREAAKKTLPLFDRLP